jgi:sec-independent protein translocase protein TatB
MPQIGPMEIMVVAVVAFLVLGPDKLPGVARQMGRYATELRKMVSEVKDEFRMELRDDDSPAAPKTPRRSGDEAPAGPQAAPERPATGSPSDSGEPKS